MNEKRQTLKEQIYRMILNKDYVTYAELSRLEGFNGDYVYSLEGESDGKRFSNIVLWAGMSEDAYWAIDELLKGKKIDMEPACALTYFIDGGSLNLPLVKGIREYKKPHWYPVCFRTIQGELDHAV